MSIASTYINIYQLTLNNSRDRSNNNGDTTKTIANNNRNHATMRDSWWLRVTDVLITIDQSNNSHVLTVAAVNAILSSNTKHPLTVVDKVCVAGP